MAETKPPFDSDELTADFRSGDPKRLTRALEALDAAWRDRRFVSLPLPEPDCLDAYESAVPPNLLDCYLTLLQHYPDFEPTPSLLKVRESLVEAMIRHGRDDQSPHTVALALRIDDFPRSAVGDALGYLRNRGLHDPDETAAAIRLVHYLLDSNATREATVEVLRLCARTDDLTEVIEAVKPRLDDSERSRLEVHEDDA